MSDTIFHWALALVACWAAAVAAETEVNRYPEKMRPFFAEHCFDCHGPDLQEAGIRLDRLTGYELKDNTLWTKVHEVVRRGEMPPADSPRPTPEATQRALSWIRSNQRRGRGATTRRLNRRELSAALQDLTGISVDYASMLPADGKVDGFDTGADGLQDAADSVARIMDVTRRAVKAIRFLEPAGLTLTANLRHQKQPKRELDQWRKTHGYRVKLKGYDLKTQGVLLSPAWLKSRDRSTIELPAPEGKLRGVARLTLVVSAADGLPGMPAPHLNVVASGQDMGYADVTATADAPQAFSYDVQLDDIPVERNETVRIGFRCLVELPYEVSGFPNDTRTKPGEEIPPGTTLYKPLYDRKQIKNPLEQPVPYTLLQEMTFEPNFVAAWPPQAWGHTTGERTDSLPFAEELLTIWMERAWRRPVTLEERNHFVGLYSQLRRQEMSFDDALRATFQSVLLSGPFRYHASPAEGDRSQYAIASRLSFMLAGAPPDDRLRDLAAAGSLRDPHVLDAEVDRLLDDDQSQAFFQPFVTQWLEIGQPITVAMRSIKNQDFQFGRYLRDSMRGETVAYVRQLFLDNRPARELVDSHWAMRNDILARFYGQDPIEGSRLRKVRLSGGDPRGGGILGHAGIQSMLTWMGENWVIYRGAWAMRHILDDPPPPPPLDVPELIPSDGENRGKTFRQLLVQHQEEPNCAVCHEKMDPIGFAFQNFDLSGRWREVEHDRYVRNELDGKVEWYGTGQERPIDTTGQLPRGEKFTTFREFKRLLADHYVRDLVRGVLKKLMLYGTGRKPDIDDLAQIDAIMDAKADQGYPMRDCLKALIRSPIFLEPANAAFSPVTGTQP